MSEGRMLTINSALLARAVLAAQLGMQYGTKRDVYEAAGYDKVIPLEKYLAAYRRGLGKRLVNVWADDTWRLEPIIWDGEERFSAETKNPFLLAWNQVATGGQLFDDGETSGGLLAQLRYLDQMVGLGGYGVLVFGLRDGKDLSEPAEKGRMGGPQDLLYAKPYPEVYAKILETERDRKSPRYGKPTMYQVTTRTTTQDATETMRVHWSRCLHVAEGGDGVYGLPRLEAVWNQLTDLLKIHAATGEGAWRLLAPSYSMETQEGYEPPDADSPEWESFSGQVDDFVHGLRRWLSLEGQKLNEISGDLKDPKPSIEITMDMIAGITGIPKRKLTGSERGELASSQDADSWAGEIATRQANFAWPSVLLPCINRLRWYGVLPDPLAMLWAEWPPMVEENRVVEGDAADKAASALQKAGVKADPVDFVTVYLPSLDATKVVAASATPDETNMTDGSDGSDGSDGLEGGGMALNGVFFQGYP